MDVTGVLVFLLLGLPTPALAVLREFYFVNQLKPWTEAQIYCREKFHDLATVETADDWTRISELVENYGHSAAWIGLYDDINSWRWSLDNTSLYERDYESLFVFEKDNYRSEDHCGTLNQTTVYDQPCGLSHPSVCYDESSNSYIRLTVGKTWQEAQSYCRQTYTDLASIRDQQELNNLMSVIDPSMEHWVGLFRESWKWSDQSNTSFTGWTTGQLRGGTHTCGRAGVEPGWYGSRCEVKRPFICSAPPKRVFKITLKTDGSVNLNDPLVQEAILKQVETDLRGQGVPEGFRLRWRKPLHGAVFNKTEL